MSIQNIDGNFQNILTIEIKQKGSRYGEPIVFSSFFFFFRTYISFSANVIEPSLAMNDKNGIDF